MLILTITKSQGANAREKTSCTTWKSKRYTESQARGKGSLQHLARGEDPMSKHISGKHGKRSSAQKEDAARYDYEPIPQARKVPGARGQEGAMKSSGKAGAGRRLPRGRK